MDNFFWQLSTRETATLVWLVIFAAWVLPKVKKELRNLLLQLLNPYVLLPLLLMYAYAAFIIYLLGKHGIWTNDLLKDAILWAILAVPVMIYRTTKSISYKKFLLLELGAVVSTSVIIEFLVNFYTFNFFVELLVIPIVTVLVCMEAVAKYMDKPGMNYTRSFLKFVNAAIGFTFIFYALSKIIDDPNGFFTLDSLSTFSLPLVLSIIALPILFALAIFAAYEQLLVISLYRVNSNVSKKHVALKIILLTKLNLARIHSSIRVFSTGLHRNLDQAQVFEFIASQHKNK